MQCPKCGREVSQDALFCNYCGATMQLVCPSCQTVNPANSRFCQRCGASLNTGQTQTGPSVTEDSPPSAAQTSSTTFCPRCRAPNEPGSLYCFRCGLPLSGTQSAVVSRTHVGEPMGFWVRFVAYLLDGVLLGIITSIIVAAMFGDPFYSSYTANVVSYVMDGVYFTIAVSVWATTIGKRIFNMRVVRMDGSMVGPGRALARYLLYTLSALIFFIGFIMIGVRADKRGLHDLICDTQVVRRR